MTSTTIPSPFSEGVRLPEYLDQLLTRFPIPDQAQERQLIQQAKQGHAESLTWLMVGHIRLVSMLAQQYAQTAEDGQDLLQEGMLGIRHAVHNFDLGHGCRFTTFARKWIRGYIRRFCYKNRPRQFRLPEKKQVHLDRITNLQSKYPDAPLGEIAIKANMDPSYVENLLWWGRPFEQTVNWKQIPYYDPAPFNEEEILDFGVEVDDLCCS